MAPKRKPKPRAKPRPAKAKRKADEPLAMGRLDTVCMAVSDLAPAPYNPRKIDKSSIVALQTSMEKFALVEPLVWNKRSRTVVGGHQRLKVLVELGAVETDVVVVDLDKADERALNLALNSPRLQGDFDKEKLGAMLEDLAKDMPELDFKALRLDELFEEQLGVYDGIEPLDGMPDMPNQEDPPEFEQIAFVLSHTQAACVRAAVEHVLSNGVEFGDENPNKNGNAISYICEEYLDGSDRG